MSDPNKGRHSDEDNGELDELKGSDPVGKPPWKSEDACTSVIGR
jgi:hypothetical protein